MKSKNLIIGLLCLFVLMVFFSLTAKSQKPEQQPKFERIEIATGGAPHWSPDGTKLAFLSGGWLCVKSADGKGEIQKIAQLQPWTFDWMSDSEFVVSEKKPWTPEGKGRGEKFIIETVDMNGQVQVIREDSIPGIPKGRYMSYLGTPFVLKDGTVGYYEIDEKPGGENRILKIIKQGKLKPEEAGKQMDIFVEPYPWGDIWIQRVDGTQRKKLTSGNRKYTLPQLSPDGLKVLAYYGSYYGGGLDVLDTNGNVIANVPASEVAPNLYGNPTYERWSPDGKRIAYCLWAELGDTTYSSDIWVVNWDGTGAIKITNTPDEIETGPVFSPDGSKIVYITESGKIFVVKLK